MSFKKMLDQLQGKEYRICALADELNFFNYSMSRSDSDDSNLVIIGPNGCGKSLMGKLAESVLRGSGLSSRSVAVRNRVSGGIERALVFGDESKQSTGFTSVKVCNLAMKSAAANPEDKTVLIYDEPDLGLSEEYSKALGREIGKFAQSQPHVSTILISHSKPLVFSYLEGLGKSDVNVVAFDPYPTNLGQWINASEPAVDYNKLLELAVRAGKMELAIDRFLNKK